MGDEKFGVIMGVLVPQIIQLIMENYGYDEITAANELYSSDIYALLEKENTKVWHFSPLTLYQLFDEEQKNGEFFLPEEV